jgi:hypothetical protein
MRKTREKRKKKKGGDSEEEQRQGLVLPVIIGVPDNSPAPFESTSAVGLPKGAASGFDPVEKLGAAEYLRRHVTWRTAESPRIDLSSRQEV